LLDRFRRFGADLTSRPVSGSKKTRSLSTKVAVQRVWRESRSVRASGTNSLKKVPGATPSLSRDH